MKNVLLIVALLGLLGCLATAQSRPDSRVEALERRLSDCEAKLDKVLKLLEAAHTADKGVGKVNPIVQDEIDKASSGKGRILADPATGVPVFATAEWRVTNHGRAQVWELIRKGGVLQPVSVFYKESAPVSAASPSNSP